MFDRPFNSLIFCLPLRVVYSPIPKAACSSLKAYLRRQMGLPDAPNVESLHNRRTNGFSYPQTMDPEELCRALYGRSGRYFKFTVCRNPYARLVSAYKDLVASRSPGRLRGDAAVEALRLQYCKAYDKRPSEAPELTFEMFVRAIEASNPAELDRHWQMQFMVACAHLVTYDMTIKLEELPVKQAELISAMNLVEPISFRLNRTGAADADLRPYFPENIAAIVRRIYRRDFHHFGYDPNDIPTGQT